MFKGPRYHNQQISHTTSGSGRLKSEVWFALLGKQVPPLQFYAEEDITMIG